MGLKDEVPRTTVDLKSQAEKIQSEIIPDLEARISKAEELADDDEADDPEESPDELLDLKKRLNKQAEDFERVVRGTGGGEFTIKEIGAASSGMLQDEVAEKALDMDMRSERIRGTPKQGFHRNRTLQHAVVNWPDGMDTTHDHELGRDVIDLTYFPDMAAEYLYDCIIELNDAGDLSDVGNSLSYWGVQTSDKN